MLLSFFFFGGGRLNDKRHVKTMFVSGCVHSEQRDAGGPGARWSEGGTEKETGLKKKNIGWEKVERRWATERNQTDEGDEEERSEKGKYLN